MTSDLVEHAPGILSLVKDNQTYLIFRAKSGLVKTGRFGIEFTNSVSSWIANQKPSPDIFRTLTHSQMLIILEDDDQINDFKKLFFPKVH
jgi:hypothetical protein